MQTKQLIMNYNTFFFEGTCRFPFLNKEITNWENITNDNLTVYDARVKVITVGELLKQELPEDYGNTLMSLAPEQKVIVNYIVQIEDEPLLGKSGDEEVDAFMTELNDRMFHAQYFSCMHLPNICEAVKQITGKSVWDLSDKERLFHYTIACHFGANKQPSPFASDITEEFALFALFNGLPEKGEATLMVIYEK